MIAGDRAVAGRLGTPVERVVLVAIALLGYLYDREERAPANSRLTKRASP